MEPVEILGSVLGLAFVSGIRLYATLFVVGLGIRLGWIHLHPALSGLEVLSHDAVLWISGAIYIAEFLADKIPWFDSVWDVVHTIIRPLGAAVLAAVALGDVDPTLKFAAALVSGGVALSSHGAKAGTRLLANHSPEPITNIGLSCTEDGLAVAGVWLSLAHPCVMLAIVAAFVIAFVVVAPRLYRRASSSLRSLREWIARRLGGTDAAAR